MYQVYYVLVAEKKKLSIIIDFKFVSVCQRKRRQRWGSAKLFQLIRGLSNDAKGWKRN